MTCVACRLYDMADECWHSPEYEPIARALAAAIHGDPTDEQVAGFIDDAEALGSDVWDILGRHDTYTARDLGHVPTNGDRWAGLLNDRVVVIVDGSSDGSGESFASIAAVLPEEAP